MKLEEMKPAPPVTSTRLGRWGRGQAEAWPRAEALGRAAAAVWARGPAEAWPRAEALGRAAAEVWDRGQAEAWPRAEALRRAAAFIRAPAQRCRWGAPRRRAGSAPGTPRQARG